MSSLSSLASDSTISTASAVPATTRSSWVSTISSSVGLSTYSSLMKPTRAAPIGPLKGAPEIVSAAEAATSARMSGSFSMSCDSTVTMIWVSLRQPSTNSGRIGRSIKRETSVRPALALEIAAGNAARRIGLFDVVDGQRQEVDAFPGRLGGDDGGEHHGLAVGGEHGAIGLTGDLAGFKPEGTSTPVDLD